jgi:hypothetical protein
MGMMWSKLIAPSGGYATIEFVGGNIAAKVGAASGDSTIALNSGLTGGIASSVSEGDLVIAAFGVGSNSTSRNANITDGPTAYTTIGAKLTSNDTYDAHLRVAYKFMGATPDTSTTFGPTGNAADAGCMGVYVFRGVDQTTPLDVAATTATGTDSPAANPPSITPVTPGAFIVCAGSSAHNQGVRTFTSSNLTDFITIGSDDTYDCSLGIGQKDNWISGAFDAAAFGTFAPANTESWCAISIALRPASL